MTAGMKWRRITLTRAEYESGELMVFLGAFRAAYVAKNGPEGMAMFGSWADDETSYFIYITPKSVRHVVPLLDAYSAKQMDMPEAKGLSLLYGDESGLSSFEFEFKA